MEATLIEQRDPRILRHNVDNPRGEVIEDDKLREMAEGMKTKGVLQPIVIRPDNTILYGHRRTVAAIMAGLLTVPVIVDTGEKSRAEQIELMLIENAQRVDLTALQTARAYEMLVDRGLFAADIARATGFANATISNYLHILDLPDELWPYFDNGEMAIGCAKELLKLPHPATRLRFGREALRGHWTIKELATRVDNHLKPKTPEKERELQEHIEINAVLSGLTRMDSILEKYPHYRPARLVIQHAYRTTDAIKSGKASTPPARPQKDRAFTSVAAMAMGARAPQPPKKKSC